jgi:hypothetical protein
LARGTEGSGGAAGAQQFWGVWAEEGTGGGLGLWGSGLERRWPNQMCSFESASRRCKITSVPRGGCCLIVGLGRALWVGVHRDTTELSRRTGAYTTYLAYLLPMARLWQ